MAKRNRCHNCGCYLDYGESCDCDRLEAEMAKAKRISRAKALMAENKRSYDLGMEEYLYG